ncbi:hypothetical protein KFL_004630020 [Klebsormidium nitens]|uniref:Uncharacterized protein n=1 Tax=Klebsormidium nitens TaxID=105231 RepID=A0A1Y1ID00_KLENI|nr:hypothetical protein KFL_004630020 [Klebsormidium nitens]|eukprot:GAQ88835.1 hypothetical protein KFL_004630020 [Klebsormidium nitens]
METLLAACWCLRLCRFIIFTEHQRINFLREKFACFLYCPRVPANYDQSSGANAPSSSSCMESVKDIPQTPQVPSAAPHWVVRTFPVIDHGHGEAACKVMIEVAFGEPFQQQNLYISEHGMEIVQATACIFNISMSDTAGRRYEKAYRRATKLTDLLEGLNPAEPLPEFWGFPHVTTRSKKTIGRCNWEALMKMEAPKNLPKFLKKITLTFPRSKLLALQGPSVIFQLNPPPTEPPQHPHPCRQQTEENETGEEIDPREAQVAPSSADCSVSPVSNRQPEPLTQEPEYYPIEHFEPAASSTNENAEALDLVAPVTSCPGDCTEQEIPEHLPSISEDQGRFETHEEGEAAEQHPGAAAHSMDTDVAADVSRARSGSSGSSPAQEAGKRTKRDLAGGVQVENGRQNGAGEGGGTIPRTAAEPLASLNPNEKNPGKEPEAGVRNSGGKENTPASETDPHPSQHSLGESGCADVSRSLHESGSLASAAGDLGASQRNAIVNDRVAGLGSTGGSATVTEVSSGEDPYEAFKPQADARERVLNGAFPATNPSQDPLSPAGSSVGGTSGAEIYPPPPAGSPSPPPPPPADEVLSPSELLQRGMDEMSERVIHEMMYHHSAGKDPAKRRLLMERIMFAEPQAVERMSRCLFPAPQPTASPAAPLRLGGKFFDLNTHLTQLTFRLCQTIVEQSARGTLGTVRNTVHVDDLWGWMSFLPPEALHHFCTGSKVVVTNDPVGLIYRLRHMDAHGGTHPCLIIIGDGSSLTWPVWIFRQLGKRVARSMLALYRAIRLPLPLPAHVFTEQGNDPAVQGSYEKVMEASENGQLWEFLEMVRGLPLAPGATLVTWWGYEAVLAKERVSSVGRCQFFRD